MTKEKADINFGPVIWDDGKVQVRAKRDEKGVLMVYVCPYYNGKPGMPGAFILGFNALEYDR